MKRREVACGPLASLILVVAQVITLHAQSPDAPKDTDAYEWAKSQGIRSLSSNTLVVPQSGPRSSPFDPPEADDVTFVTDAAPKLDTGCLFRGAGPITFQIGVTRFVGDLNSDGTLRNANSLVAAGLLSPTATLSMPAFDVDSSAVVSPPFQPERDRLLFNGEDLGFLSGENNVWKLNSFEIPIEKVKFAQKGTFNTNPTPGMNEIQIDIDIANVPQGAELWCTAIDWGTLTFKAMSPVILIHGNNSNGGFYDRQGFSAGLEAANVLFDGCGACDNPINLATGPVRTNGQALTGLIPGIAKAFGVDSVHLVTHSKGGLDTRDYLVNHQPRFNDQFMILSYTSLSTPHNGSAGADVLVTREIAARLADKIEFVGFPSFTRQLSALLGVDAGTPNLTTGFAASFNRSNVGLLPPKTVYNAVAADADRNGTASIDILAEYNALLTENGDLDSINDRSTSVATGIVDRIYQILRNTASVTVAYRTVPGLIPFTTRTIATITNVPNPAPLGNDTLVTIPSGLGIGTFSTRTTSTATFTGGAGRNHADIADAGVAATVSAWIIAIEREVGDLR